jgi:probable F420-dependent oxidoreductase, MSMEG_2516 family
MVRAFRFGVVSAGTSSGASWTALAQRIEALGYSTLLIPDRTVTPYATLTAMAFAAAATKTLRVGSYVFCNNFRHPIILAHELATLDQLSNGRLEIGIGAGLGNDFEPIGLPLDSPGTRVSQVTETVQILKQFFTTSTINFAGNYYTIKDFHPPLATIQQPHPPIFIASTGHHMLNFAAREADIIAPTLGWGEPVNDKRLAEKIAWVREEAGERFEQIELSQTNFGIEITDSLTPVAAFRGGPPAGKTPMSTNEAVELLSTRREQFGFSYIQISEGQAENFAPVVAQLRGK